MEQLLTAEKIGEYITKIVTVNPLWQNLNLSIVVIANPKAGVFTQKNKSIKCNKLFMKAVNNIQDKQTLTASVEVNIYYTKYPNHATELTNAVIAELCAQKQDNKFNSTQMLIVSAGGDGTSLEIQTSLFMSAMQSPEKRKIVMEKCTVLRLPLGTGNDGTDGHKIEDTIELLQSKLSFANARAIKIYYEGTPNKKDIEKETKLKDLWNLSDAPWYAFNIASIGIDAYITYMTNKMKSSMPGNSYQFWVNMAAALYDTQFASRKAKIEILDKDNNVQETITTPIEFVLLGASGNRTYGSNHHILPDDNNICITPKLSLVNKLIHMNDFSKGTHVKNKLSLLYNAEKLRINYDGNILVQMDGEARLLTPNHFPLIIERTAPCVRILEQIDNKINKGNEKIL